MKFSYNWLKEYLDFSLKPDELARLLTMYSFETEILQGTKKKAVFDIDVLPNRFPDAASHLGVARELRTVLAIVKENKLELKEPKTEVLKTRKSNLKIKIEAQDLCSRYSAALVENIRVKSSPEWLKEKLAQCGVASINNIVDITNFVMLETGQPIHAFDFDKVAGKYDSLKSSKKDEKTIFVRRAKKGEKITTLDGKRHKLDNGILIIADKKTPLALAGIKGGRRAEISKKTKRILLEAAHFNRRNTFITSKKLGIESDAARRFSSGLSENLPPKALSRAAYLVIQEAGGKLIDSADVNYYQEVGRRIKLNLAKVNRLIGVEIPPVKVKKILKALNCQVKKLTKEELVVKPPQFRKDLNIAEDLIEEVARLQGYNNLPSHLPYLPLAPVRPQAEEVYQDKVRTTLKGAGFSEVYNYSLLSKDLLKLTEGDEKLGVFLENPISKRFSVLRPSLLPGLLRNVGDNLKYENAIRLFEIGKVFQLKSSAAKRVKEDSQLGIILSLSQDGFFELKGVIEFLFKSLGIGDFWFDTEENEQTTKKTREGRKFSSKNLAYSPENLVYIKIGDKTVGILGRVSPFLLRRFKIKQETLAVLVNIEELLNFAKEEHEYRPPSKYPSVMRDIAILVDEKIKFSQILNVIEATKSKLVQDVDLFDIYEGERLPQGKKSLAFHIIYQSDTHTLKDKEVNKEHQKIEKALKKELGATIR